MSEEEVKKSFIVRHFKAIALVMVLIGASVIGCLLSFTSGYKNGYYKGMVDMERARYADAYYDITIRFENINSSDLDLTTERYEGKLSGEIILVNWDPARNLAQELHFTLRGDREEMVMMPVSQGLLSTWTLSDSIGGEYSICEPSVTYEMSIETETWSFEIHIVAEDVSIPVDEYFIDLGDFIP